MSDAEGLTTVPYTFTINNTCNLAADYYVIISTATGSFTNNYIDYQYNDSEVGTLGDAQINTLGTDTGYSDSYIIASGTLRRNRSIIFNIRIWLNEDAEYEEIKNSNWSGQVKVISKASTKNSSETDVDFLAYSYEGTHTQSDFASYVAQLNQRGGYGATVDCSTGTSANLLPSGQIVINQITMPATCTVVFEDYVVDGSGANPPKLVNNLIPVVYDESTSKWKMSNTNAGDWYDYGELKWANAVTVTETKRGSYNIGDTIEMSDILGMWVWIPRYEYKYTNLGNQYAGGNTTAVLSDPIVKPNVIARRYQKVSDQYETILNVKTFHGIETMDSHMSKNSEWGAVTYLSQSIYGKRSNTDYSGTNKEVYINNSSSYYTGRSMGAPANTSGSSNSAGTYQYNDGLNGRGASTTGTIYGIYDMSGGSWEYQMGWLNTASTNFGYKNDSGTDTNSAGFDSAPSNHRYYEEYTTTAATSACGGIACYGSALSETAGWYGDYQAMVSTTSPWFARGALYGYSDSERGGVFAFYYGSGSSSGYYAAQAVLV